MQECGNEAKKKILLQVIYRTKYEDEIFLF